MFMRRMKLLATKRRAGPRSTGGTGNSSRSVPPYGDRKWRLYNLRDDPNEARDMSSAEPELARAMLADFAAYAARNGVIEVPADYDVIAQARANAAQQSSHYALRTRAIWITSLELKCAASRH